MFKVKPGAKMATNWCVPKEKFQSFRGNQVTLRFEDKNNKKKETCCFQNCQDFDVFVDLNDKSNVTIQTGAFKERVVDWYIAKYYVTGFKNYKFNGIPISDTWLNPNMIDRVVI